MEAEGGEGERLPTRSGLSKHSRAGGPLWRGGGARERAVAAIERAGVRVSLVGGRESAHTYLWCTRHGARALWVAVGDCHGVSQPSQSVRGAVGDGWCTVVHTHGVHREVGRWPEAVGDGRTVGGR